MITYLTLDDFIESSRDELIIDVRTPLEFEHGHIIGAANIPLFTNEERVLVGTCYKQQGRQPAILLGFELIGARWAENIRTVETILNARQHTQHDVQHQMNNKVFIHCWRGGMRSGSMAWALNMYGFDVYVLTGGYKTYRRYYLDTLEKKYPFIILSGKTGCAKTATLLAMQQLGEQVIDLEGIAQHQGSSFGSKGEDRQPSQEQFENLIAHALLQMNLNQRIWLENESIVIGQRSLPACLFEQMRDAHIIDMQLPVEDRINFLDDDYGKLPAEFLKQAVLKISKRLGPNETKLSLQAINEGRMKDFIKQVLVYYDKTYQRSQDKRLPETIHSLPLTELNPLANAKHVIECCHELFGNDIQPLLNAFHLKANTEEK